MILITTFLTVLILTQGVVSAEVCPDDWTSYHDNGQVTACVKQFVDYDGSWMQTRSYCHQEGADLIIIGDARKNDFIKKYLGDSNRNVFWIGLSDTVQNGTYTWLNETTSRNFTAWDEGQPDQRDGNCVAVSATPDRDWFVHTCTSRYKFICEILVHQTSVATTGSTSSVTMTTVRDVTVKPDVKRHHGGDELTHAEVLAIGIGFIVITTLAAVVACFIYHRRNGGFKRLFSRKRSTSISSILRECDLEYVPNK